MQEFHISLLVASRKTSRAAFWAVCDNARYAFFLDCVVVLFLKELADCMAGDKRIDAQEALLLGGLIQRKHPEVVTAYTNYTTSQV